MKRYISPGWADSRCFICEEAISLEELLGQKVSFDRETADVEEVEYKYAKILPYTNAVKLSDLAHTEPVIQFMLKDHLANFPTMIVWYSLYSTGVAVILASIAAS